MMGPAVGRSIRCGFVSANRGVKGIVLFAVASLLLGGLVMGLFAVTRVPEGIMQADAAAQVAYDAEFYELSPELEAQQEEVAVWFSTWWPLLLFGMLLLVGGSLWLNGGQIGYVANVVRTQHSNLPAFWQSATRAFVPLLSAWGLSILGALAIAVLFGLFTFLFALMGALPGWLLGLLGVLLGVSIIGALVWLAVRLVFWFIAIVVDAVGPVEALKATFHATHGRWLQVFSLILLLGAISMGVGIAVSLLQSIQTVASGFIGSIFGFIGGIIGIAANLYIGFVGIGAFVQFYEDTKNQGLTEEPSASAV